MKERNLREMGRLPGFRFHEQDMLDVAALRGCSRPTRSSCTSPPGGRAALARGSGGLRRRPT